MFKTILIIAAVLIAAVFIYAATRPDNFRVERRLDIAAPAEKIFPLINDFHQWALWSPWEKVDPAVKRHYSGAENGAGAVYEWSGNNEIGQGRMTIIESSLPGRIIIQIDFIKPFEGHNTIEFTLVTAGNSTTVTQAMYGASSYIHKLMGIFFSMDKMIGSKYEEGLARLKSLAES